MSTGQADFQFRFGLKTMLLALTALGVSIGLLGKLFYSNFQAFVAITSILVTAVPFLLAVGTLMRLGVKRGQSGLTWWGLFLLLVPLGGGALLMVLQQMAGPGTGGMGFMSNQQLIVEKIMTDGDHPAVWRELERRVVRGKLNDAEVDQAMRQLVAFMKQKRPQGWDQPLSWQDDFVRKARQRGAISEETLIAFCDTFFGTSPQLPPLDSRGQETQLSVRVEYGTPWDNDHHSGIGVSHLWTVTGVLVDGVEMEIDRPHRFAQSWSGMTKEAIPAGAKELTAEVEIAYVDADKMIGITDDDLPPQRWPKAIKRWSTAVTIPLDGSSRAAPRTLQAVTDPGREPLGEVSIDRLVAQQDEGGRSMLILQLKLADGLTVPLSFDAQVTVDEEEIILGGSWAAPYSSGGGRGQVSGGMMFTSRGHVVDPAITITDVTLLPNREYIQEGLENNPGAEYSSIQEVWAKPILFQNVPLERLDLEARRD